MEVFSQAIPDLFAPGIVASSRFVNKRYISDIVDVVYDSSHVTFVPWVFLLRVFVVLRSIPRILLRTDILRGCFPRSPPASGRSCSLYRHIGEQSSDSIHVINGVSDTHEQRVTVDRKTRHTSEILGNKCLRVQK